MWNFGLSCDFNKVWYCGGFLQGVSLYSDEFLSLDKTPSQSRFSPDNVSEYDDALDTDMKKEERSDSLVIFGKLSGRHEITIRFKQCDSIIGPKVS